MDIGLEIERLRLELADLRQYVESIPRVPATELGAVVDEDIPVAGDTIPEIVDQTGAAGTSEDYRRTDCVPKLALAGAPADDYATAGNATLQFAKTSGGLQVRLAAYAEAVAALDDIAGADGTGGLGLPVATDGGFNTNAGGCSKLAVKADADADNILSVGANGVLVKVLASTTKRGLTPQLTAPAAGIRNILGIDNAETALKVTALFDNTNPEANGTAAPGTSLIAARRDHVHAGGGTAHTHEGETGWETSGEVYAVFK